jgi:hypothetical protein
MNSEQRPAPFRPIHGVTIGIIGGAGRCQTISCFGFNFPSIFQRLTWPLWQLHNPHSFSENRLISFPALYSQT